MAAAAQGQEACLRALIEAGADIEAKDKTGWTAAMLASYFGHDACLAVFIGAGADLDAKDKDERTAGMWAAITDRLACMEMLIGAGANIEATDKDGSNAAMLAAQNGHAQLASFIEEINLSRSEADQMRRETAGSSGVAQPGLRGPRV